MFLDFASTVPRSPLLPEVQLAVAATYEQEKKLAEAIAQYDHWLASFTNAELRARAEYYRAWDTAQAGGLTNALASSPISWPSFRPTSSPPRPNVGGRLLLQPRGDPGGGAELQVALPESHWAASELTYQAQLMAGRAAVGPGLEGRQGLLHQTV